LSTWSSQRRAPIGGRSWQLSKNAASRRVHISLPSIYNGFYVERFGYQRGDFPVAESLGERSLALPFSSVMTEVQVSDVCEHLSAVLHKQTV
jgi:dTDP-4-amino-4,6-dideoxygalactose transaminase